MSIRIIFLIVIIAGNTFSSASRAEEGSSADLFKRAARVESAKKNEIQLDLAKEKKSKSVFKIERKVIKQEQAPGFDYEGYRRAKAKLIFARRQKAIALAEKILKGVRSEEMRIKIRLQLAESYMENFDYYRLIEQEQYNQAWKKFNEHKKGKPPKLNETQSKKYKEKAVTIYKNLYKTIKEHPQRDEILYFLGYLDYEDGFHAQALKYFLELISRYPQSRLVPDTELKLGDYYFGKREIEKALKHYGSLYNRRHGLSNYARYKMAWCYYNQKNYDQSIRAFKEVVQVSQAAGARRGEFDLTEDALNDLVVAYAEARKPEEAKAYFSQVGGVVYYNKLLEKLADIYYTTGRHDQAISVYRELLENEPNNLKAPEYHRNIIESYRTLAKPLEMRKAMVEYVEKYNLVSTWAKANSDRQNDVKEAAEAGEFAIRKIAKETHFVAQKSHNPEDYNKAVSLYEIYLKYYGHTEFAYEMKFFFAEALYQISDYKRAGSFYTQVSQAGKNKKYYVDATYGGITAFMAEMEKANKGAEKPPVKTKDNLQPIPIEGYQEDFLKLVASFVQDQPMDNRSLDLQYRAAYLCYDKNNFPCARERFLWVIKNHPKSERAIFSAHLILNYLGLKENYNELADTAKGFFNNKQLGDAKFKQEMRDVMSKSRFKAVEKIEAKGDHAQAAEAYAKIGLTEKGIGVGDKALYKAAQNFDKAKDYPNSLKHFGMVVAEYPSSPLATSAVLYAVDYHRQRLHVIKAAQALNKYIQVAPSSEKDVPDAHYDIAVLYEAAQNYKEAGVAFKLYAEKYPSRKDAPFAYRKRCEMLVKRKVLGDALQCYQKFQTAFPGSVLGQIFSDGEIVKIYEMQRNKAGLDRMRDIILQKYGRQTKGLPPGAKTIVARAEFEKVEELLPEYNRLSIKTANPNQIANLISRKLKLLTQLESEYTSVLKYGVGEWGVPALFRLGVLYQKFAEALINSPKPKGLTPEQVSLYEEELQKIALPLDDKGRGFFEQAYQTAQKLKVYTPWTRNVYSALNKVDPESYPVVFEQGPKPKYLSEFLKSGEP